MKFNKANEMHTINLYSKRWSVSNGLHWHLERECSMENAQGWLALFQKDEPEIEFKLAKKKPKICCNGNRNQYNESTKH